MENSWVLVDLGYMSFLRYHATKIWFKWQDKRDQENPWQNVHKDGDIIYIDQLEANETPQSNTTPQSKLGLLNNNV